MSAVKVVFMLLQIGVVFSAIPQVQKCSLKDSKCIKSAAQPIVPLITAGIPELGIDPMDPMIVKKIIVDLAGLKLTVKDAVITGLNDVVIDKLSVDTEKKEIKMVFHTNYVMVGKYKASGMLLILPISGDGDAVLKLDNCQVILEMPYDIVKDKDGKDVIELKSYKFKYDVKDNAHFTLGNLFNGNKELSDTMHTFMNSQWKALTEEFGNPMFEQPIQRVFNAIKAFLSSQPLEDIANV